MREELFERIKKDFKLSDIKSWEGTTDRIRDYAFEISSFLEKNKDEKILKNAMEEFQNGILTKDSRDYLEHYLGLMVLNMVYYYGERGLRNDDLLSVGIMVVHNVINENTPNDGMIYVADKIYEAYRSGFKRNILLFECPKELRAYIPKVDEYVTEYRKKTKKLPNIQDVAKAIGLDQKNTSMVIGSCRDYTLSMYPLEDKTKPGLFDIVEKARENKENYVREISQLLGRREQVGVILFEIGGVESALIREEEAAEMFELPVDYIKHVNTKAANLWTAYGSIKKK